MLDHTSDKHYEEKFESTLWQMIRKRAEDKDISYVAAYKQVAPEYFKTIDFYKDTEQSNVQTP